MHLTAAFLLAATFAPLSSQQAHLLRKVEHELVAPCCYSQSIDLHMSREAAEMRDEVTQMIEEGMTEKQIIEHYKAVYGERILSVPDGFTGAITYFLPVVAVLFGTAALSLFLWRALRPGEPRLQPVAPPTLTTSQKLILDRIRSEVGEEF